MVFDINLDLGLYDAKRFQALLGFFALLFTAILYRKQLFINKKVLFLTSLALILGLISTLSAHHPFYALSEWSWFTLLGLLVVFLSNLLLSRVGFIFFKWLLVCLMAALGFYVYSILIGVATSLYLNEPPIWPLPIWGFINIRFFSQFLLGIFFITIYLGYSAFTSSPALLKLASNIIVLTLSSLLFYSLGRGALYSVILATLVALLLTWRTPAMQKYTIYLCVVLFSGAVLGLGYLELMEQAGQASRLVNLDDSPRLYLWKHGIHLWLNNPLLGVGPMHYSAYPNPIAAHPHNSIIQILSEWGSIVTLVAAILVVMLLRLQVKVYQHISTLPQTAKGDPIEQDTYILWLTFLLSWLAQSIYSLVSGVFVMPYSQFLYAVNLGALIGMSIRITQSRHMVNMYFNHQVPIPKIGFLFILSTALAIQINFWWKHWSWVTEYNRQGYFGGEANTVPGPRYFLKGAIPATLNPPID